MPIPQRKQGQAEETFIADCISKLVDEYDKSQAAAICYQQLSIALTADKNWRKDFLSFKPESTCLKHYTHKPSEEYRKG
jgi:hypothetical protein